MTLNFNSSQMATFGSFFKVGRSEILWNKIPSGTSIHDFQQSQPQQYQGVIDKLRVLVN